MDYIHCPSQNNNFSRRIYSICPICAKDDKERSEAINQIKLYDPIRDRLCDEHDHEVRRIQIKLFEREDNLRRAAKQHIRKPRKRTQDSKTATRVVVDEIVKAASKLFNLKGRENTSLNDIAAAAYVNKGSIRYHFATNELLFEAVKNFDLKKGVQYA